MCDFGQRLEFQSINRINSLLRGIVRLAGLSQNWRGVTPIERFCPLCANSV